VLYHDKLERPHETTWARPGKGVSGQWVEGDDRPVLVTDVLLEMSVYRGHKLTSSGPSSSRMKYYCRVDFGTDEQSGWACVYADSFGFKTLRRLKRRLPRERYTANLELIEDARRRLYAERR